MKNLRGAKIVNQDSLMVENSHLYIKAKDENYCELTILDENGKKRKVGATWSSIIDKPTSFTPSTHTHEISDINNLQGSLENKLDKPTSDGTYLVKKIGSVISYETFSSVDLSNYYTKYETFSQTEINNLLNNKQNNLRINKASKELAERNREREAAQQAQQGQIEALKQGQTEIYETSF